MSRPSSSTSGGTRMRLTVFMDPRRDVPAEEAQGEEDGHRVQLARERRVDVVDAGRIAGGEQPHSERAPEPADAVDRDRADRVVHAHLLLDEATRVDRERAAEHRDEVVERRCVDVRAGRDRDHAGESTGQGPERIAAAREVAAREATREADRDRERDRRERGRVQVDVAPARKRRSTG